MEEPSVAQQRYWLIEHTRSGPDLLTPLVVDLTGPLDRLALRSAVDALVARHRMLRVRFTSEHGLPRQVVDDNPVVEWESAETERPPRLDRAPVLRVTLLRIAPERHVLTLVSHRTVVDSWSMRALFAELVTGYSAFAQGKDPVFAKLPVAISGDFSRGSEQKLVGADFGVTPLRDHPVGNEGRGKRSFPVVSATLTGIAARFVEDAPVRVVLMAAFAVLLARFSGEYDLTVAHPVVDRRRLAVGPFENIAVSRAGMAHNPPFRQLVRRLHAEHSQAPVETLLSRLRPQDYLDRGPLAGAAFDFTDAHPAPVDAAGLRLAVREIAERCAEYPIVLRIRPSTVEIEYRADWFDAEMIELFLKAYRVLLGRIADDPDVRVQDVVLHKPIGLVRTPSGAPCGPGEVGRTANLRARVRPNGSLEVLGETERIRGISVNPERVNALLARQPGVRASAVLRMADHLVAFVVPHDCGTIAELRRELLRRLPLAAVPEHFVAVAELPVTESGQPDRAELRQLL